MSGPCSAPSTTTAPLIPDKILPNLYLSDIHTAAAVMSPNYNAPGLSRPRIKYILSVIDVVEKQPKVPPGRESEFVLKLINIRDLPSCDLLKILGEARSFIQSAMHSNDGGILVHCRKGVSRSASVVIAYVMEDMNLDFDTAFQYVRSARPKVLPNPGFQQQLELWSLMRYTIYTEEGNEKLEYLSWKARKELELKKEAPHATG